MAPIHRRIEKPPKSWRQNLTHSGVVGGGVRALGPSRARMSWARWLVRPWGRQGEMWELISRTNPASHHFPPAPWRGIMSRWRGISHLVGRVKGPLGEATRRRQCLQWLLEALKAEEGFEYDPFSVYHWMKHVSATIISS